MKSRWKFVVLIIVINMLISVHSLTYVKAQSNYKYAERQVNQAIKEKTFYNYNLAYEEILKLPEGYERDILLSKLGSVADTVWTKDIYDIVHLIGIVARDKSGRAYDSLQSRINKASLKEVDKEYLLSEIGTWGRDIVWTEDYNNAVASVIKVWNKKTKEVCREAERYIREIQVPVNREYMTELLNEAKTAVGLNPLILDDKYFSTANTVFMGQGKSISLDLSRNAFFRTIILKGKYEDLYINAPKSTVILEDAEVENLNLLDAASGTILISGNTVIKILIAEDKDNNANIIIKDNSIINSAEIRSGATIEVNTNNEINKPFHELKLKLQENNEIKLIGNFKESSISIEKPVRLKVEGIIQLINISKEADKTNIILGEEGSINTIDTLAWIKIGGKGEVGSIKGEGNAEFENNPPVEGRSMPWSQIVEDVNSGSDAGGSSGGNGNAEDMLPLRISWDLKGEDIDSKIVNISDDGDISTISFYLLAVKGTDTPDSISFAINCHFLNGNSIDGIEIMDETARIINGQWYTSARKGIEQAVKIKFKKAGIYDLTICASTD